MIYSTQSQHQPRSQNLGTKPLVAASLVMVFAALLMDFNGLKNFFSLTNTVSQQAHCNNVVSDDSKLSRDQLAQLLTIPERDTKSRVRQVVSEPYCQLPTLKVRSGVDAEREAYPLAFDPGTTLVILYENDEYAGYRFSFE
ncbi:MAG: hypothetical protein AAGI69_17300 [Cyanobacteria bacterium P01_H01_bin.21]